MRVCVHTYICACVYTYICVYIYIYIYTHTYIYIWILHMDIEVVECIESRSLRSFFLFAFTYSFKDTVCYTGVLFSLHFSVNNINTYYGNLYLVRVCECHVYTCERFYTLASPPSSVCKQQFGLVTVFWVTSD